MTTLPYVYLFLYSVHSDAVFELVSVVMNVAFWHTKHSAILAGKDDISMDEAKEVHRSLKMAAGMFLNMKESLVPRLPASPEKGTDTDPRVVEAYAQQSQAEAQEGALCVGVCIYMSQWVWIVPVNCTHPLSYSGQSPGTWTQTQCGFCLGKRNGQFVYLGR